MFNGNWVLGYMKKAGLGNIFNTLYDCKFVSVLGYVDLGSLVDRSLPAGATTRAVMRPFAFVGDRRVLEKGFTGGLQMLEKDLGGVL